MTEKQKLKVHDMRSDGFSYAAISAAMDIPVGTVKSFCSRHLIETTATGCKQCGKKLINTAGHRQKIFCSPDCRKKYWKEHTSLINRKTAVTTVCAGCGAVFADYAGRKRKYCSHACYINHRYKGGDDGESE